MSRRTISCEHCGYMQLKRDEACDQCGQPTARVMRKEKIQLYEFGFRLLLVGGVLAFAWSVIPHG
jgi:hypothetical protein